MLSFESARSGSAVALNSLEEVARDIEQSVDVTSPVPGDGSPIDQVVIQKLAAVSPTRMEPSGTGTWAPQRAEDLVTITYRLDSRRLLREEGSGEDLRATIVAEEVDGFSAASPRPESVQLAISIQESRQVKTFRLEAFRWIR